jgi:hypothetical protein
MRNMITMIGMDIIIIMLRLSKNGHRRLDLYSREMHSNTRILIASDV